MRIVFAVICLGTVLLSKAEGQGSKMIDAQNAVRLMEAAAKREPMDEVRRRCYAGLLYYVERYEHALAISQEFLKSGRASASLYGRTARLLALDGDAESSMRTLENGAAAHPKSARLVLLIGLMHEQSGAGGAERFYRKAVEVDADFANAHFRLANLLKYARGDDAGCVLHCSRVLELEDRDSRLARQAIELLSQCPRRSQDPAEEKSLNAGLLFHEGRSADAAKLYRDLAGTGAPRPGVYYRLAEMAMEEAEWATVDAILTKAIREHPDNARLHYLTGEMWLRRRDSGKAAAAFRKAIALNDDFVPGWYRLTYLASQQGAALEEILATATRVFELEEIDHPLARETLRIVEQTLTAAQ